jgi:hypothetical protein
LFQIPSLAELRRREAVFDFVAFTSIKSESKIKMDLCPVQPFELGSAQTCESAERPIGQRLSLALSSSRANSAGARIPISDDLTFALC